MGDSTNGQRYFPNAPAVVSETIDGETIIMHHGSGHYFDTDGEGSTLWQAIEGGATLAAMAQRLSERHGMAADGADAAARHFLATLAGHDLIRGEPAGAFPDPPAVRKVGPQLGVHTDLADMLLLDPIHDVGEAGWPAPPSAAEGDRA